MGNEAGDADSIVSALTLSYIQQQQYLKSGSEKDRVSRRRDRYSAPSVLGESAFGDRQVPPV